MNARTLMLGLALGATAKPLPAQDTRDVREPVLPAVCVSLAATLVPVGDSTLAEADERTLDTRRIQAAIDACPAGRAVALRPDGARRAFLVGPLRLGPGVTLLVEHGVIVFASRDPREYDLPKEPGRCGTVDEKGHGCRPLIGSVDARGAAVMGEGVIDGRGWAKLLGSDVSWWDLAEQARAGGSQNNPRLMHLLRSDDFTLYGITLRNAPQFHVLYTDGNGFTAWGVRIWSPARSRNTDGIDPQNSRNVTITRSWIHVGDDNVAIKAQAGPSWNITVSHNHFFAGHGMSIGSETNGGVSAIRVSDLTIDGADNGLRIKSNESRGGPVRDVVYEDVCIRDTKNPVYMDTHYSAMKKERGLVPVFQGIELRNVHILGKGRLVLDGFDASRPLGITFDDVTVEDPAKIRIVARHARVTLGPGPVNFAPAGEDVTVSAAAGSARAAGHPATSASAGRSAGTAPSGRRPAAPCADRFEPFPAH